MKTLRLQQHVYFDVLLEELKLGKRVRIQVRGRSMHPFLRHEVDFVWLCSPSCKSLRIGSIVLACLPDSDRYVLHRVVARTGDRLTLQGDAHRWEQESCYMSDVLACVEVVEHGARYIEMNHLFWVVLMSLWCKFLSCRKAMVMILKQIG